jgi:hypothetical protein
VTGTEVLQIAPIEINILQVFEGVAGKLVPVIVSLNLIEVDIGICKVDNGNEVVPVDVDGVRANGWLVLVDSHTLRRNHHNLVRAYLEELSLELDNCVGYSPGGTIKAFDIEVHSVQIISFDIIDKRNYKVINCSIRGKDSVKVSLLSPNRKKHLFPTGFPFRERSVREVCFIHLHTAIGLSVYEREDDDCGFRVHIVGG